MYCLDTYALWEIQHANPKYSLFSNEPFVIAEWTFVEFYRSILKQYDKLTADYWLRKLQPFIRKVQIDTLLHAVVFQEENKKTDMSIYDCVGYTFAQENALLFVTGDKEFKEREGVLFIQK